VSDIHGHAKAFDRLMERLAPGADDSVYILGDLIDRGPNPLDVVRVCRAIPNVTILAGNHEDLMLASVHDTANEGVWQDWIANGGSTTAADLTGLLPDQFTAMLRFFESLPLYETVEAGGRLYGLVHAGIRPFATPYTPPQGFWDQAALAAVLERQRPEDLLWIRNDFWERPTGLVGPDGEGPVIVAGHTPSTYCAFIANGFAGTLLDDNGRAQMLFAGAQDSTGGVPDKICVDCGAAMGAGRGQVGALRLDDLQTFYEPILEGE
jgi:serine/threonine protein phosphatase 1